MAFFPQIRLLRGVALISVLTAACGFAVSEEHTSELTVKQAVSKVQAEVQGTVVSAEKVELNDKPVYRVRVVFDGHVRDFYVDAVKGALLPDNEQE